MVPFIEDMDAFQAALSAAGDKLVVVDFTATWCGPCKLIGPKFVAMAAKAENSQVVFLKVDVDDAGDIAEFYEVTCMPSFLFFRNGEKWHRLGRLQRPPFKQGVAHTAGDRGRFEAGGGTGEGWGRDGGGTGDGQVDTPPAHPGLSIFTLNHY
ncbi:hypothetical protein NHX12_013637 [Muraenolepis orangiensis]|uniref:Thioredoxin domain-containing protein n=1 Tax=Muraenolepis orangiensis TaxID=630683 RepID=A0A9Q0D9U6_9TELE|nr:hypothetical protein NHX12_013637 [Muraenolepis orangiensis]